MVEAEVPTIVGVEPEVAQIIHEFTSKKQSFISLDVYCKLGIHFNDSDNPICEQVRAAYGTTLMPSYLCKWVLLRLEGGGFANVWKYYLPEVRVKEYMLRVRGDGRVELTKKVLGSFSLLEIDLGCRVTDGNITYHICDGTEDTIVNASSRIRICSNTLREANLNGREVIARVFPNKIEISERQYND